MFRGENWTVSLILQMGPEAFFEPDPEVRVPVDVQVILISQNCTGRT